jgi:LysM repeat protein
MAENTPDSGKNIMDEAVDMARADRNQKNQKKDSLLLRYIGALLVLTTLLAVFLGIQLYSMSQQLNDMTVSLTELERRIAGLEKQQADIQGKTANSVIANEVQTLSTKVSELEKRMAPSQTGKKVATESPKQSKAVKKRYHEVKRGETLYRISKQYGMTVDELRRLNKLSPNQPIEVGQKLLVSKVGS